MPRVFLQPVATLPETGAPLGSHQTGCGAPYPALSNVCGSWATPTWEGQVACLHLCCLPSWQRFWIMSRVRQKQQLLSREHLPWWHTALALPLAVGHKIHLQIGYYDERKFTRTVHDWAGLVARDLACIHPEPP
ncbi:hypothetical protein AZSI13_32830 [Azospira sp. I13]|nr:hypothetical protein AZSI13_32830 [Azospira sp. I13]